MRFHGVYRDFIVNDTADQPEFVLFNFLQLVTITAN